MRTDLAKESKVNMPVSEGIREQTEYEDGVEILRIDVLTEEASQRLDKPIGRYVSVTTTLEDMMDRERRERLSAILSKELKQLSDHAENALVVGLGNRYIAADALGKVLLGDPPRYQFILYDLARMGGSEILLCHSAY